MRKSSLQAIHLIVITVAALAASGCQHVRTQQRSNELITTVPDLYYQQVVDNLALAIAKPGTLPFFGLPTQGSNTNTRTGNASYAPGWDFITTYGRYLFDKQSATVGATIANAQAFQLQPIYDPDKLILIQTAFRRATGDRYLTIGELHRLTGFYLARPNLLDVNDLYYYALTHKSLSVERQHAKELSDQQHKVDDATKAFSDADKKATLAWQLTRSLPQQINSLVAQIQRLEGILRDPKPSSAEKEAAKSNLPYVQNRLAQQQQLLTDAQSNLNEYRADRDVQLSQLRAANQAMSDLLKAYKLDPDSMRMPLMAADSGPSDEPYGPFRWIVYSEKKPKHECYAGQCCKTWVFVPSEARADLTLFTDAILDLASIGNVAVVTGHTTAGTTGAGPKLMSLQPAFLGTARGAEGSANAQYLLTPRLQTFPFPLPPQ